MRAEASPRHQGEQDHVHRPSLARRYAMSLERREAVESPGAWLTTVAGRICLDVLGSARARRERYVGEWIPEPVPDRTEWISGRPGMAGNVNVNVNAPQTYNRSPYSHITY
ncbi:hypothetical protein [Spongiactinospora sp. TRM90649]|uniref:hypothetical protein n=1 Tax=Spongiactinospora sp. TRM90649 TaxID=3031114 RepID=UPI003211BF0B